MGQCWLKEWILERVSGIPCRFCRSGWHHHQLGKGERAWWHWTHSPILWILPVVRQLYTCTSVGIHGEIKQGPISQCTQQIVNAFKWCLQDGTRNYFWKRNEKSIIFENAFWQLSSVGQKNRWFHRSIISAIGNKYATGYMTRRWTNSKVNSYNSGVSVNVSVVVSYTVVTFITAPIESFTLITGNAFCECIFQ